MGTLKVDKETAGKLTKRDVQNRVREYLFAESLADMSDMRGVEYGAMSSLEWGIIQSIIESSKKGDFAALRQIIDFVFEKKRGGRK
jgi:hypothetical protein